MKSLKESLEAVCHTMGLEYRERKGNAGMMSGTLHDPIMVLGYDSYFCEILKDGVVVIANAGGYMKGDPHPTQETAREWLLYSLISKAL